MQTELFGGPQDGLTITVPPDCRELRFPVAVDPGFIKQFRKDKVDLDRMEFPIAIYQRYGSTFHYVGEQ